MNPDQLKEFAAIYHHKFVVMKFLNAMTQDLLKRMEGHDNSKFTEEEFVGSMEAIKELSACNYGTPEYEACRKKHAPTFERHYKNNRHHPEHFKNGVDEMTLIDLVEMLADWKAASMRAGNGSIANSITIGSEKYKLDPQLIRILLNTANEYKM